MLAGAHLARWFWIALNVGVVVAVALVIWLMTQRILTLATQLRLGWIQSAF